MEFPEPFAAFPLIEDVPPIHNMTLAEVSGIMLDGMEHAQHYTMNKDGRLNAPVGLTAAVVVGNVRMRD